VTIQKQLSVLVLLLLTGCITPGSQPAASSSCAFEPVWDASVAALSDFQLQAVDKASGAFETQWMEVQASTQAGLIQRDVNRERLKYVVEVKPDGRGTVARVVQLREEWSPMGVRSRQWRAIPGYSSEEETLAAVIRKRLKEQGC
jgi:hypothetical protein